MSNSFQRKEILHLGSEREFIQVSFTACFVASPLFIGYRQLNRFHRILLMVGLAMAAEISHVSDASIVAGVLAAAEAALPCAGLELLVWGAARRGDQATLRYLLANDGKATCQNFWKGLDDADHNGDSDYQDITDSNCGHARVDVSHLPLSSSANGAVDDSWAKTHGGTAALCFAAAKGDPAVVDVLLKAGVDASASANDDGVTPLLITAMAGHEAIVDKLLKTGVDTDKAAIDDGTTPLIEAVWNGYTGIVKRLLESGADVNKARAIDGSTPLLIACMKARGAIVEQLIQAGADLDKAKTDDGSTPLLIASGLGYERIVERLLRAGANPNKARTTDDGYSPLGMAVMDGNERIVKQLIKAGASITVESGESALNLAAWEGHIGVCYLLLEAGADVNHASKTGETPLSVAVQEGNQDTALFLFWHGASSAGGLIHKSTRQKMAKWIVQEMMQNKVSMDDSLTKLKARVVQRSATAPCLLMPIRQKRWTLPAGL